MGTYIGPLALAPHPPPQQPLDMPKKNKVSYSEAIVRAFEKNYDGVSDTATISLDDLYLAAAEVADEKGLTMEEKARVIKNMPDASYNLRSRAKSFPTEISDYGFTTLEIIASGVYQFNKGINDVALPSDIDTVTLDTSGVPGVLMGTTGVDEQAMLAMLTHSGAFGHFLNAECWINQGHMRSSGTGGQQIEADFVLGCTAESGSFLAAVEGKGIPEKIGYSQMKPTIAAVKSKFPDHRVVALAAKMDSDYSVMILQFDYTMDQAGRDIESIKLGRVVRYVLDPAPTLWS